jgi:hypothetical protein
MCPKHWARHARRHTLCSRSPGGGDGLSTITDQRTRSMAFGRESERPSGPADRSLSASEGSGHGQEAERRVVVYQAEDLINRPMWYGGKLGFLWYTGRELWRIWLTDLGARQGDIALSGSPLHDAGEHQSAVCNRSKKPAKWMGSVLGGVDPTAVGTSPAAGEERFKIPGNNGHSRADQTRLPFWVLASHAVGNEAISSVLYGCATIVRMARRCR